MLNLFNLQCILTHGLFHMLAILTVCSEAVSLDVNLAFIDRLGWLIVGCGWCYGLISLPLTHSSGGAFTFNFVICRSCKLNVMFFFVRETYRDPESFSCCILVLKCVIFCRLVSLLEAFWILDQGPWFCNVGLVLWIHDFSSKVI